MIDNHANNIDIPRKMLLIGITLGLIVWIADAVVDGVWYHQEGLLRVLFSPSPSEVLRRSLFLLLVAGFSLYAGRVVSRIRRAEKTLLDSEKQYHSLFETARDVIFFLSVDGTVISLNPAFETVTGWQRRDVLNIAFFTLVHPDDLPQAMEIFQAVLRGQAPDIFELRIRARSGVYITGEFTVMPESQDNRVIGALGIGRDITRRKQAEQALQESEGKYRDLFENANDLIQSVDADGKFIYVNRAWRETLGYTAEEVVGLTLFDIIHPDFRKHCSDVFSRVSTGEQVDNVETVFMARNGRSVVVEGNINCSIVDGRPIATRGIFRDITEHRHATEFIRNILESVDEGFIVVNSDYQIISANKAYGKNIKVPLHDIIGRHCYEVSHRVSRPCYETGEDCAVRHTFQTGEPYTALHIHSDSEGNPIYIETKAFPLKDSLGRIVSAIEIHNDISDRKRLEDQLRHVQKMEAVGTLAGGIAHDFNNILTAIIGYGTLLQMKMGEQDPLRTFVDQILTSTERAANLTQSLLAFSRKQVINLQPIALNTLVNRVKNLISRLIGEEITVVFSLADVPMTIRADAGQIEQVLMNLATNARDAMPQGGLLNIQTRPLELDNDFIKVHGFGKVGRYALLSVTDTGMGMDEKTRNRVFEPFFTTKEVGKGTGLGLSIVYGIVKQHDGYITVESEPGKGTTFWLYLPLVIATLEEAKLSRNGVPEGGRATILVAEDDDGVRNLARAVLEGFGYTVIAAVNGDDALMQFAEHKDEVQLLLLDVIMPKKSGKTVYDEIAKTHPGIKVLFTSGYAKEIIHQKGILENRYNFISKPVSPGDLLQKVKEVLDAQSNTTAP